MILGGGGGMENIADASSTAADALRTDRRGASTFSCLIRSTGDTFCSSIEATT